MRLFDYRQSSEADKNQWLNTFKITTGLKYFGGKSQIGKDLMHRICNMAERMDMDGKRANIFIDGFTGGGKIGLSIPEGWFDNIVMNDLNYGIVSYYKCCKDYPKELFKMIKLLGSIMNKDIYNFCAFHRSNNGIVSEKRDAKELIYLIEKNLNNGKKVDDDSEYLTKEEKENELKGIEELIENKTKKQRKRYKIAVENINNLSDEKVEELVSGAMTYWVTQLEFIGMTDPYEVSYVANSKDNMTFNASGENEKERINRAIIHANKQIRKVHDKLNDNNIIIENLDYRELIKKYNGKPYYDIFMMSPEYYEYKIKDALKNLASIQSEESCGYLCEEEEDGIALILEYFEKNIISCEAQEFFNELLESLENNMGVTIEEIVESVQKVMCHYYEVLTDDIKMVISYENHKNSHLHQNEILANQNKLWYFDPPYHPATLYAGMEAPYEDKFSWGMANEMVKILHNDDTDTYGELEYFIKSDYDPKMQYNLYSKQLADAEDKFKRRLLDKKELENDPDIIELKRRIDNDEDISKKEMNDVISKAEDGGNLKKQLISLMTYIIRMKRQVSFAEAAYHDFDVLEENTERTDDEGKVIPANKINPVYYKLKLGEYSKGVAEDTVGSTKGVEYVWCRGNYLPEDDNLI